MNNISISGNLGRDAEVRALPNGDPVASFSVADSQGKEKPTIWWNCQLFGKRAQALSQYLRKGQQVTVSGVVSEREWTDKEGQQRKSMEVRVTDIALQGGKQTEDRPAPQRAPERTPGQRARPEPAYAEADDSDIPF